MTPISVIHIFDVLSHFSPKLVIMIFLALEQLPTGDNPPPDQFINL